jgi:carboxymethylenebutenolidase
VLAACSGGVPRSTAAPGQVSTAEAPSGGTAEVLAFSGPAGQLRAAWAGAAEPRGAVLVIHENRGLTDHFKALPRRFAADGYSALAVDLLSREGGTGSFPDPAEATAALAAAPAERLVADLSAGIDELERRVAGQRVGAVGFCFGGGLTWELLNAGEARLAAAVPFYGPLPASPDFSRAKAAVLAIYAELDARVNRSRDAAATALDRAHLVHEIMTFPGVDHAFFNDTGPRYNARAAAEAYRAVLGWFARYLQ